MQRKPTKNTRGPNAAEKAFQAWLKDQPCCVTGAHGSTEVHHMYGASFKHKKVLIGHWACIPLCYDYHRGDSGYHTLGQKVWRDACGDQAALWDLMVRAYEHNFLEEAVVPDDVYNAIMDWGK